MPAERNLTDQDYELLSAYIDGELSDVESSALENRLETEANLRRELAALRQTIALVNQLPPLKAPRDFVLAPAAVPKRQQPRRIRFTSNIWLAAAAMVLIVTTAAVVLSLQNPAPLATSSQVAALPTTLATTPTQEAVTPAMAPAPLSEPLSTSESTEEEAQDLAQSQAPGAIANAFTSKAATPPEGGTEALAGAAPAMQLAPPPGTGTETPSAELQAGITESTAGSGQPTAGPLPTNVAPQSPQPTAPLAAEAPQTGTTLSERAAILPSDTPTLTPTLSATPAATPTLSGPTESAAQAPESDNTLLVVVLVIAGLVVIAGGLIWIRRRNQ